MKLVRRNFLRLAGGAVALTSLTRRAAAQDAYPSRPVHVIIGFTPGSAADVVARVLSQCAAPFLGHAEATLGLNARCDRFGKRNGNASFVTREDFLAAVVAPIGNCLQFVSFEYAGLSSRVK